MAPRRSVPGAESRPAKPGEAIELYATGLGRTAEFSPFAEVLSQPLSIADPQSLKVRIDGEPSEVLGAWMTYAGLYQINVVIPSAARSGNLPLLLEAAGISAQPDLVIAVER